MCQYLVFSTIINYQLHNNFVIIVVVKIKKFKKIIQISESETAILKIKIKSTSFLRITSKTSKFLVLLIKITKLPILVIMCFFCLLDCYDFYEKSYCNQ